MEFRVSWSCGNASRKERRRICAQNPDSVRNFAGGKRAAQKKNAGIILKINPHYNKKKTSKPRGLDLDAYDLASAVHPVGRVDPVEHEERAVSLVFCDLRKFVFVGRAAEARALLRLFAFRLTHCFAF